MELDLSLLQPPSSERVLRLAESRQVQADARNFVHRACTKKARL